MALSEVLRIAPGGLVLMGLCCNSFTAMQLVSKTFMRGLCILMVLVVPHYVK